MDGGTKKKRGRPVVGERKNRFENFRTTDSMHNMLSEICKNYGVSKTKVFEKMIQNQYNLMKNGFDLL